MLIRSDMNPWVSLIFAFAAGMLAGMVTGLLHTKLGIPPILAGILTQIALYSINLNIMGQSNQAISVDKYSLAVSLRYVSGDTAAKIKVFTTCILFGVVIVAILYWYFGTEQGHSIRATGCNPQMARAQGINTSFCKVLALMISNGLVGLSGALYAQYQGAADVKGHAQAVFGPARKNHLPELNIARAESASAGIQIIAKHTFEAFRVVVGDFRPAGEEALIPGHQRRVVVGTKIMPVFHNEMRFAGFGNMAHRRQAAVREDIFVNPRVNAMIGFFRTDGMQQETTVGFQITIDHIKIGGVIFRPDMFEHADGNNTIEAFVQVAIVLEQEVRPSI